MWDDYDKIIKRASKGKQVDYPSLTLATAIVCATLMLESCQRPSAVTGVTLKEFKCASEQQGVTVIKVKSHKTMRHGAAMLTLTSNRMTKINSYVKHVRPLIDPFGRSKKLLVLPGEKEVVVGRLMKKLSGEYDVTVPTATSLRKAMATAATSQCSEREIRTLSTQLSHSIHTHRRSYEQKNAKEGAAEAFKITQSLKSTAGTSKPKERKRFTLEEVEEIENYFNTEIVAGQKASLQKCREFLRDHPMDRSPKQIQDKVANIIKYA